MKESIAYSPMHGTPNKVTWTSWPGNNRFCCKKKCITGPSQDDFAIISAHLIILSSLLVYAVTEAYYLYVHIHPSFSIIIGVFGLWSEYLLLRSQFTDPGIIPRGDPFAPVPPNPGEEEAKEKEVVKVENEKNEEWKKEENENKKEESEEKEGKDSNGSFEKEEENKRENGVKIKKSVKKKSLDDPSDLHIYKYRWCDTCKIWRPPKGSHCSTCDNCVREYDHHCVFINNCVGQRNMKHFVGFLIVTFLLALLIMSATVVYLVSIVRNDQAIRDRALQYVWVIAVGAFLTLVGGWFYMIHTFRVPIFILPFALGICFDCVYLVLIVQFQSFQITPLPCLLFTTSIPVTFWLMALSCGYIGLISQELTEKQRLHRKRALHNRKIMKEKGIKTNILIPKLSCRQMCRNICVFFCKTPPKSQIFPIP